MTIWIIAGAVACAIGGIVFQLVGEAVADEAMEAIWRRGAFGRRQGKHGGLLMTGALSAFVSAACGLLGLVIITNQWTDDDPDATWFFGISIGLAVLASGCLVAWWHRAGRTY